MIWLLIFESNEKDCGSYFMTVDSLHPVSQRYYQYNIIRSTLSMRVYHRERLFSSIHIHGISYIRATQTRHEEAVLRLCPMHRSFVPMLTLNLSTREVGGFYYRIIFPISIFLSFVCSFHAIIGLYLILILFSSHGMKFFQNSI